MNRDHMHSHQCCLAKKALNKGYEHLKCKKQEIEEIKNFDILYNIIREIAEDTDGLGELYSYDTALRIGRTLGIKPDYVYLHAGTRKGAKRLGLNHKADKLSMKESPECLRSALPEEIEDFLCLYKDCFALIKNKPSNVPINTRYIHTIKPPYTQK